MKKIILLVVLALFIASCSTHSRYGIKRGNNYRSPSYSKVSHRDMLSAATGWAGNDEYKAGADKEPDQPINRVVIYNANIGLAVKNADTVNANLSRIAERYKGYALTLGNEYSVIRVKSQLLKEAVVEVGKLGKVKYKRISGEDVTDDYQDSEIRLDNAKKARQRYLELLAKAENVQAALMVEKELERLNKEIDQLEGHLKRLDHLSEFSTITVNLDKKVKPGILGYIGMGLYYSVKWLFVRN